MRNFGGSITALLTPFRDGAINLAVYETDVERQIESGTDGLVACGTTAEAPTLSASSRERLLRATVAIAAGRVPVIAGTGSNCTEETIAATRKAREFGADAALVVTPYYNRPSQEGLFRHYEAIASKTDIPLILYNVPARTGVDLLPETVARLAALPSIIGIKEATDSPSRSRALLAAVPPAFPVYSGDDRTTLATLLAGGAGSISVISNAMPWEWAELVRCALGGRQGEAQAVRYRLGPLLDALALESNPCPVKYLMSLMYRGHSTEVRLPLVPIGAETAARIRHAFDAYCLRDVEAAGHSADPARPQQDRHDHGA